MCPPLQHTHACDPAQGGTPAVCTGVLGNPWTVPLSYLLSLSLEETSPPPFKTFTDLRERDKRGTFNIKDWKCGTKDSPAEQWTNIQLQLKCCRLWRNMFLRTLDQYIQYIGGGVSLLVGVTFCTELMYVIICPVPPAGSGTLMKYSNMYGWWINFLGGESGPAERRVAGFFREGLLVKDKLYISLLFYVSLKNVVKTANIIKK